MTNGKKNSKTGYGGPRAEPRITRHKGRILPACDAIHSFLHIELFILASPPLSRFLGGGRKPENPEKSHTEMGRT